MLKTISEIKKYFKHDPKTKRLIFTGKELIIKIPKRYEVYDLLHVGNNVKTLGIVDLEFDQKERAGLMLLANIKIHPSSITQTEIKGLTYYVLTLNKGDIFIDGTDIIQDSTIAYSIFVEFVSYGKLPYFISYDDIATLFDTAERMTGSNLDMDHVIFEMIYAHLFRDPNDIMKFYRHTDLKTPPVNIPLRSITAGPQSTTAKIMGSYFPEGLNSALVHPSKERHVIEDLLRS